MITFKCKMCGGDLSFEPGASVAECPYCGTNQTLPKLDDDKRANLYDRANHFRRQNEYDKAMAIYEQILAEDRTDAEAYWSLVLCRYGIEYVEDPTSHKRVPTVNRAQYASILADEDYKSALNYADTLQRGVYEAEANAIAEIQKGILDISKKEEPFDVFICYKETDANGRRTPDSVLATDLYHQLTKEGFKVFFSRITLEDKIGTAYEPYIFAALNSAKVMVVLGTKPEYFNAVWVKNEWSRYLALIKNGADKVLVPAYRDMDPYDLPEEFAHLQAQDMGKLGFMQDLIRGIKKLTAKDAPKPQPTVQRVVTSGGANIDNLMKRAKLFMEDGDWTSANDYLDKVLDENAEYAPAYVGKVQAALKLHKEKELSSCLTEYEKYADWRKAMRFAAPDQKTIYEGYSSGAKEAREEKHNSDYYTEAMNMLQTAKLPGDCARAKSMFAQISGYRDADEKQLECDQKARRIEYEMVDHQRNSITIQPDSVKKAEEFERLAQEFEKLGFNQDAPQQAEWCRDQAKHVRSNVYDAACNWMETDNIQLMEKAEQTFRGLRYYKDSEEREKECLTRRETLLRRAGLISLKRGLQNKNQLLEVAAEWDKIADDFRSLQGAYDTDQLAQECAEKAESIRASFYYDAVAAMQDANSEMDYNGAAFKFRQLGEYRDAPEKVRECGQRAARVRAEAEAKVKAEAAKKRTRMIVALLLVVVIAAGAFAYVKIIKPNGIYNSALKALDAGNYEEAGQLLLTIKGFKDADGILASDERLKYVIGNTISFGCYEQDDNTANGSETIEWIVLADDVHTATLISKYGLDTKPYNAENESVTWESCTLRKWLNGDFLNAAFSAEEQTRLEAVTVTADKNPKYDTNPGNDTQDKVFLLSIDEAESLFSSDDERMVQATAYAKAQGAYVDNYGNSWWWLRSPGNYGNYAAFVDSVGSVSHYGRDVGYDHYVVRPVVVLRLS